MRMHGQWNCLLNKWGKHLIQLFLLFSPPLNPSFQSHSEARTLGDAKQMLNILATQYFVQIIFTLEQHLALKPVIFSAGGTIKWCPAADLQLKIRSNILNNGSLSSRRSRHGVSFITMIYSSLVFKMRTLQKRFGHEGWATTSDDPRLVVKGASLFLYCDVELVSPGIIVLIYYSTNAILF